MWMWSARLVSTPRPRCIHMPVRKTSPPAHHLFRLDFFWSFCFLYSPFFHRFHDQPRHRHPTLFPPDAFRDAMDAPDPLLEAEPDFLGDPFHQTRADLAALNIPEDTITNCIRQTWITSRQIRHDAWAEDRQRRRQSEPLQDGPPQDGPPQDEPPHLNDAPQLDPIEGD